MVNHVSGPAARPAPSSFFEWFDRVGRPLLRVIGVLIVAGWGFALTVAALRSAFTGVGMPDMTAGLMPLVVALGPNILELVTRHREVMATTAGAMVNPHGGPMAAYGR